MGGDLDDDDEDEAVDLTQMTLYNADVHRFYTLFSKLSPQKFVKRFVQLLAEQDIAANVDKIK